MSEITKDNVRRVTLTLVVNAEDAHAVETALHNLTTVGDLMHLPTLQTHVTTTELSDAELAEFQGYVAQCEKIFGKDIFNYKSPYARLAHAYANEAAKNTTR